MKKFFPVLMTLLALTSTLTTDNVCTFHTGGRAFSLKYLEKKEPYTLSIDEHKSIMFNFCEPFVPDVCAGQVQSAYSFMIIRTEKAWYPHDRDLQIETQDIASPIEDAQEVDNEEEVTEKQVVDSEQNSEESPLIPSNEKNTEQTEKEHEEHEEPQQNENPPSDIPPLAPKYEYRCIRFSSNSFSYYFYSHYEKLQNLGKLQMMFHSESQHDSSEPRRHTELSIKCSDSENFDITNFEFSDEKVLIEGHSSSGCPIFQVSSLWSIVEEHYVVCGLVLLAVGFHSLFFGRIALETTIFIAGFFVCLAILGSLLTVFIGPNSKPFVVYLSFILLLFACTLLSYGITRLVDISLFFVGAWLGLILGVLINSLFAKIFHIYSVWSLVGFVVLCALPLGLLTFRYRNQIIIASTSITGAYLIIRPVSWVFGGFPNEFLLYHLIETNQIKTLPWTFFIYLALIVTLAIIGSMYQFLKLHKEAPYDQLEINYIQETVEGPLDKVKFTVQGLIDRNRSTGEEDQYYQMREINTKKDCQHDN